MDEEVFLPEPRRAYGWLLRAIGWIMRAVGLVGGVVGIGGVLPNGLTSQLFADTATKSWLERLPIFLAVAIVSMAIVRLSLPLSQHARRHLAPVTAESRVGDMGAPYVLYLRPFSQDQHAASVPVDPRAGTIYAPYVRSGWTYEERLARVFRQFGSLVTVGRPGEQLPVGSGARRVYVPRYGWEPTVSKLISKAWLIILVAGPGKGTVWEYVEVMRQRAPSRLIVLVTNSDDYKGFQASSIAAIEGQGVLAELQARYGQSWQAPVLPDLPPRLKRGSRGLLHLQAMLYFSVGWQPHLAVFDSAAVSGSKRKVDKHFRAILDPVMTSIRTAPRL